VTDGEYRGTRCRHDGGGHVDIATKISAFADKEATNEIRVAVRPRPRKIGADLFDQTFVHLPQESSPVLERFGKWSSVQGFPERTFHPIDHVGHISRSVNPEGRHSVFVSFALCHLSQQAIEIGDTIGGVLCRHVFLLERGRRQEPNGLGSHRIP
jgi:hypothetical protein